MKDCVKWVVRCVIAHHPEFSYSSMLLPSGWLPQLHTEHDIIWYRISFWLVQVPAVSPPSFLVKITSTLAEPRTYRWWELFVYVWDQLQSPLNFTELGEIGREKTQTLMYYRSVWKIEITNIS